MDLKLSHRDSRPQPRFQPTAPWQAMIGIASQLFDEGSVLPASFENRRTGSHRAYSFVTMQVRSHRMNDPWVETHGYIHPAALRRGRQRFPPILKDRPQRQFGWPQPIAFSIRAFMRWIVSRASSSRPAAIRALSSNCLATSPATSGLFSRASESFLTSG